VTLKSEVPLPRTFWVDPGRLLAGPWPGDRDAAGTELRLRRLLDCGIRTLVDLTEPDELDLRAGRFPSYPPILERLAETRGLEVAHQRFAIEDADTPQPGQLDRILGVLAGSLAHERPAYVHCWGGRGRTGVVVAAWLIARGRAGPEDFERVIARLRDGIPTPGASPQTAEQCRFVRRWASEHRLRYPSA
jgi:hypothetical protein